MGLSGLEKLSWKNTEVALREEQDGGSHREVGKQNVVQERDWALNKKEGALSCTNQGKGQKDACGCEHV